LVQDLAATHAGVEGCDDDAAKMKNSRRDQLRLFCNAHDGSADAAFAGEPKTG